MARRTSTGSAPGTVYLSAAIMVPMDPVRWHEIAATAAMQHSAISRAQLRALGHDRSSVARLVASGRLERRAPGAYVVVGSRPTWDQAVVVAALSTDGVVSHRTAAVLWGFDRFPPAIVEISLPRSRLVKRTGIRLHVADDLAGQTVRRGAVVVTDPARTIVDLAGAVAPDRLEHALDGALRDRLVTVDDVAAVLARRRRRGRRGSAAVDTLLQRRGDELGVPESVLERMFLRLLEAHGLPRPELQVSHGRSRVDAQFTAARIVIELDGHRTHATRRQRQHDAERARPPRPRRLARVALHVRRRRRSPLLRRRNHW